ncbi:hypothetical protein [Aliamphritea ceti]|uniref:hypothetical protein n=1 Tax=Aliamphritea ceti TaxID=1524258 RepID=UPI0021C3E5AE|nr:hypothetical protein [Aliamphritea ceti]
MSDIPNQSSGYSGPDRRASPGWHVDKNISITHILTTFAMIVSGLWFMADQDKRIAANEKDIQHNAQSIVKQDDRITRELGSINRKLDKMTDLLIEQSKQ